mmetsp:Transcript_96603/g.278877  ORF Transcript_96603/g.278877 Transcript_96603/m.278877 type:complete len:269 (-) Transcript_96603:752-1558(-)
MMPAVGAHPQKRSTARSRRQHRTVWSQAKMPAYSTNGRASKYIAKNNTKPPCAQATTRPDKNKLYTGMQTIPTMILYEATTSKALTLTVELANAVAFSRWASRVVRTETGKPTTTVGIDNGSKINNCNAAISVRHTAPALRMRLNLTSRSVKPAARRSSTYSWTSFIKPAILSSSVSRLRDKANILFIFSVSSADIRWPRGLYSALIVRKTCSSSQSLAPGIMPFMASSTMVINSCTARRLSTLYMSANALGTSNGSPNSTMTLLRKR